MERGKEDGGENDAPCICQEAFSPKPAKTLTLHKSSPKCFFDHRDENEVFDRKEPKQFGEFGIPFDEARK